MTGDGGFLSRWSRRKIDARAGKPDAETQAEPPPAAVVPAQATPDAGRNAPSAGGVPESSGTQLPPVESLTPESDFTAFMQPDVDPGVKREALKVLLRDPRFNVMDGLDVYIDDYSKPDPLPEGWLAKMNQMKHLGAYLEAPEEPEIPAQEAPDALQKSIPEQPLPAGPEGGESDTRDGAAFNAHVTESGTAGGKLPRNEA